MCEVTRNRLSFCTIAFAILNFSIVKAEPQDDDLHYSIARNASATIWAEYKDLVFTSNTSFKKFLKIVYYEGYQQGGCKQLQVAFFKIMLLKNFLEDSMQIISFEQDNAKTEDVVAKSTLVYLAARHFSPLLFDSGIDVVEKQTPAMSKLISHLNEICDSYKFFESTVNFNVISNMLLAKYSATDYSGSIWLQKNKCKFNPEIVKRLCSIYLTYVVKEVPFMISAFEHYLTSNGVFTQNSNLAVNGIIKRSENLFIKIQ